MEEKEQLDLAINTLQNKLAAINPETLPELGDISPEDGIELEEVPSDYLSAESENDDVEEKFSRHGTCMLRRYADQF